MDDPAQEMDGLAQEMPPQPPRRRASLIPLGIMGLIFIAGLVMLWRGSFRRELSDAELERYLDPGASDYDTGHAAEEMIRRIQRNDPARTRFYPKLLTLAESPIADKRRVVAWVLGYDRADPGFRAALLKLVEDPAPIVRYNAAPALALHGSDAGRAVLLAMLRPSTVVAPLAGVFHPKAKVGDAADPHVPLGTITAAAGTATIEPSLPGRVLTVLPDGSTVAAGAELATLGAADANALNALVALRLQGIGRPEDAAVIEAFLKATPDLDPKIQDQAQEALLAVNRVR